MKLINVFRISALVFLTQYFAFAQNQSPLTKLCGTEIKWRKYLESIGQIDNAINCPTFGVCDKSFSRDSSIPGGATPVMNIHLLFHVFRQDDGTGGATADRIDTMMQYTNSDFAPYKIQFCYSAEFIDNTYYLEWDTIKDPVMRNTFAQNPTQQINIYVVDMSAVGWGGLGTLPWDPGALTKAGGGIVVDYNGVKVNKRLLTHEMGHNLGLWHTFHGVDEMFSGCASGCYEKVEYSAVQRDSVGDFCSDTDPTPLNFTCDPPTGTDNCSTGNPPWPGTNNTNYMGYHPDSCRDNFTPQQAGRMRCWTWDVLSGYIPYGATACSSGSAPIADFYSILRGGCSPLTVDFVNTSSSWATSWSWDFGDAGTSTAKNPSHTYMSEGNFNVSLTATNTNGSGIQTKSLYIIVSDTTPALSYSEDFESLVFPPDKWVLVNKERDDYTWKSDTSEMPEPGFLCSPGDTARKKIIGDNDTPTAAAIIPYNGSDDNTGFADDLISPPFDFRFSQNPLLTFSVAYQQWDTANDNRLKVFYTTDCGATHNSLYDKAGAVLATVPGSANCKFIPDSANDWRIDTIDLSVLMGQSKVQFKFEFISGWDNYMYLDNINISITNAGIENEGEKSNAVKLFANTPNPFSESTILHFEIAEKGMVQLEIRNMLGQQVSELINGDMAKGKHDYTLTGEKIKSLPSGIYYCILHAQGKTSAIKMVLSK